MYVVDVAVSVAALVTVPVAVAVAVTVALRRFSKTRAHNRILNSLVRYHNRRGRHDR